MTKKLKLDPELISLDGAFVVNPAGIFSRDLADSINHRLNALERLVGSFGDDTAPAPNDSVIYAACNQICEIQALFRAYVKTTQEPKAAAA